MTSRQGELLQTFCVDVSLMGVSLESRTWGLCLEVPGRDLDTYRARQVAEARGTVSNGKCPVSLYSIRVCG